MGAYDIETFKDEDNFHIPYCIVYIYKNIQKNFYYSIYSDIIVLSIKSIFNEKLLKSKKNLFYIHNLNFDGILIINSISKCNWKFSTFMRTLDIYSISIEYDEYIIEFRCSYKILPSSLKKIAESFSLPQKKIFPYQFSSLKNLNYIGNLPDSIYFNSKEDWEILNRTIKFFNFKSYSIEYCIRDVEITLKFIQIINKMIKSLKISIESTLSAPSLSLKIFLNHFNNNKIKIKYITQLDNYVRPAYKGGHTNVYGNPKNDEFIYYYDFPGMYGSVMREKFPYGEYSFITNNFDLHKPGYYSIEYESNMNIPILPHHRSKDGKLMFVNGILTDIYWFEEILIHLKYGGKIKKIHYGIVFEKYDYIFNDFLNFFQNWREKGGEYKTFSKLMVNSLYGRLGMQIDNTYTFFTKKENLDYYNKKYEIIDFKSINDMLLINIMINQKFIKNEKIKHSNHKSNISIAAAITSKARIKLYNAFIDVIEKNGRILYTDTDSIFAAYKREIIGEKHGEIFWDPTKNDTKIKDAIFISPKAYALKFFDNSEIIRIKGYNQKTLSFNNIKDKFYQEEEIILDKYKYLSSKNFTLQQIDIQKKFILNNFNKRKFSKDKKETIPYYYKDWNYY